MVLVVVNINNGGGVTFTRPASLKTGLLITDIAVSSASSFITILNSTSYILDGAISTNVMPHFLFR